MPIKINPLTLCAFFQVAARTLGDLVRKLGERVLPEIIPILERGLDSDKSDERQGVCIGLSEIVSSTSKEQVNCFQGSAFFHWFYLDRSIWDVNMMLTQPSPSPPLPFPLFITCDVLISLRVPKPVLLASDRHVWRHHTLPHLCAAFVEGECILIFPWLLQAGEIELVEGPTATPSSGPLAFFTGLSVRKMGKLAQIYSN